VFDEKQQHQLAAVTRYLTYLLAFYLVTVPHLSQEKNKKGAKTAVLDNRNESISACFVTLKIKQFNWQKTGR